MRVQLFAGKGGVGKTTLAAAAAAALATAGQKVLVCSVDPAHSLADALGRPCGDRPAEVEAGLSAMQLDTAALLADRWPSMRGSLAEFLGGPGRDAVLTHHQELTVLPGVEEMLALAEVRRLAGAGLWDVVVLDCGPTAETVRMLAWPEAVAAYVERCWPRHRRAGSRGLAVSALNRLDAEARAVSAMLSDPARCGVRLVCTPQRVVVAETRRTLTTLALHGLRVDGVVVNRVLPAPEADGRGAAWQWLRAQAVTQAQVVASVRSAVPTGTVVDLVAERADEPIGIDALGELGTQLTDAPAGRAQAGERAAGPSIERESGSGAQSVWVWTIELPLVEDAEVALDRVDEHLVLTVGASRRRVRLPALVRRCHIVDAEVAPGRILVRCTPDPAQWSR